MKGLTISGTTFIQDLIIYPPLLNYIQRKKMSTVYLNFPN